MRARNYVLVFAGLMAGYMAMNWLIWNLAVEDLATGKYAGGDLTRMGYVYGSRMPRQAIQSLPVKHIEMHDYDGRPVDVLTIGDSFSNSTFVGENGSYQSYIATLNHFTVVNMWPFSETPRGGAAPVYTFMKVFNSGYLDKMKPKYLLMETVERAAIERLGKPLDITPSATIDEIDTFHKEKDIKYVLPVKMGFINDGNLKYIANNLFYYPLFGRNLDKNVGVKTLDRPLFSVKAANKLVYLREDALMVPLTTPEKVRLLNENLNQIADMLAKKGIVFYFMVAVDKSDLYGEYIAKNPLEANRFFELLRPLPKRYHFIDTKAILAEELRKGTKDLYYADDTHWSWRASEAIFKKVTFSGAPVTSH